MCARIVTEYWKALARRPLRLTIDFDKDAKVLTIFSSIFLGFFRDKETVI